MRLSSVPPDGFASEGMQVDRKNALQLYLSCEENKMKRFSALVLALIICVVLLGCSQEHGLGNAEMTEFYSTAREALRVSTGIVLPENPDLDLKDQQAHDAELEILRQVIQSRGSKSFDFDLTQGVSDNVRADFSYSIGLVMWGVEFPPAEGYILEYWTHDDYCLLLKYKTDDTLMSVIVAPTREEIQQVVDSIQNSSGRT